MSMKAARRHGHGLLFRAIIYRFLGCEIKMLVQKIVVLRLEFGVLLLSRFVLV